MGSIKPLPESVRNSLRSGIILFDLTRVVEELVFNSLDAGATKVSVYVGIGTCYVKVVDDGCGISRDGLVLLGERYVTSKLHHLADMDSANESFGFRGEALASISDVSLLEIVTKARGMPNGYRKVLKGSRCLYLGVNDDRKDVGTTVVVRDLFYNQPVRRKCMQSSLKKVLNSVKKCVLRIALVRPKVAFKVVDTENEDELLCTRPSSALSLLMSGFGIEDSCFFHELDVSNGVLKLSGYISGPCDSLTFKAFQYVYINSRFVCKGPIHKLLTHLATRFERLDSWKANSMSEKGKKCKPQACPAYILNLSCPSALYDLSFEPSKTHAEFKDWMHILDFVENSIQQLWREKMIYESFATGTLRKDKIWKEDFLDADVSENFEFAVNKCEIQKHKSSHHHASSHFKIPAKEVGHIYSRGSDKVPFQGFCMNISEFKEQETDTEFLCHSDYTLQSWNGYLSKHASTINQKSDNHLWTSDDNFLSSGDYFLEDRFTARQRSSDYEQGDTLGLEWQSESPKITSVEIKEFSGGPFSLDYHKFGDELEVSKNNEKPFLKSCSSQRSMPLDRSLFKSEEGLEFPINDFKTKRRRVCFDEKVHILKIDARDHRFDIIPGAMQQHEATCSQKFPVLSMGVDMPAGFDSLSRACEKSFSFHGKLCAEEKGLGSDSFVPFDSSVSCYQSGNSEWHSLTTDALFKKTSSAVEHSSDDNSYEWRARLGKRESCWHFADGEETEESCSYKMASNRSNEDNFISKHASTMSDVKDHSATPIDFSKPLQGYNLNDELSLEHSDVSVCETEWLQLDLYSGGLKSDDKYENQENQLRCRDWKQGKFPKERCRRSRSAPPFYRNKKRFISLSHHSTMKEGNAQLFHDGLTSSETDDLEHLKFQPNYVANSLFCTRSYLKNGQDTVLEMKESKANENCIHSQSLWSHDSPVEGLIPKQIQCSTDYGTKWRNGSQQVACNNTSSNVDNQRNILDISSGFLHLAGNSLVPESFHKNFLEDAKVLQQVDKKFIPIMAGGTLAVIDQHAADERIRLEELRQKVISGEGRTIAYLDAEKELILPEIGYQLLHSYGEQIRDWGWICNIEGQGSGSFKKNLNILHQRPTMVTLLAVPCILGVNLSDGDLLEFLQQLADTDGSSTMPPSVIRVLNFKACRGAIMFGDSLLPSECALIVEELKKTSLSLQCAHGRPTTVPLVNLVELHKQIAKIAALDDSSSESWHGLHRQELSLERAAQRLSTARG
ncbi:DNA mismatch repair protein MLH3 isoform X2 [Jatropha curcas]|uniref:DNA mismatch repair protein MLH3 isoform X2 n=1 Tax=Jatropha curcas TaxID=180498 RepID=UPI0009D74F21|nr:DNA mismatch repair protein MLH3 isoform X2 [Jatropha curcas]